MNHLGDIANANRPPLTQSVEEQALGNPGSEISTPSLPKMCHAFSRYRKYLHSYYNRNPIVRDDKLSIAPCSQFINLALVKKDDQIDSFTESTLHGGVDEINKSKIPVGMDAIVTSDSQFVLVEGPPGIGKSTLCWELCRKWDTLKSLKDYKIVLQLKLRERRVQNASSLQEIFYHRDKKISQSLVDEVYSCEGEGVLLIFDGFDEMPTSIVQDKDNLLMELISGTSLPSATRLVTSRPSALHHKEKCFPRKFRHIEILGFTSDESKVRYAKLAFESEPEVFASFKSFVFSNPIIKSLMYIPVNCAIISQVYKDIRRSSKLMPKTMTQLYSTLIPVLIKRYMIEKGEWDSHHGIPGDLEDLPALNRVRELAYNGLLKEDIKLMFTDSDVGEGFQHLGLLRKTTEIYMCEGAVSSYSFLHQSIQEFLAAWHIKCHPKLFFEALTNITSEPQFTTFGYFMAGMFGFNIFDSAFGITFQIICIYEAQDCSQLSNKSHRIFRTSSNPMEMYAFGYVLVHAPIQWHLSISDEPHFDILESSLSDHASSIDQIHGSIEKLTISLSVGKNVDYNRLLPPKHLLHSITKCDFQLFTVSMLHRMLPEQVNINDITISVNDYYQDDYILYGILRNLPIKDLSLKFENISLKGIQVLCTFFSSSCTVEKVQLKHNNTLSISNNFCNEVDSLHRLVEAALSCSSVKSLETNILFSIPPTHHHIEAMVFLVQGSEFSNPAALLDCLLCIAEMCRVQSMNTLKIRNINGISIHRQDYGHFLSVLNDSLHQNPSMCNLDIDPSIQTCFKLEELHKDHLSIRRTLSLSDIATEITVQSFCALSPYTSFWRHKELILKIKNRKYPKDLQRSRSCVNLLSPHTIHPLLYKALFRTPHTRPMEIIITKNNV